MYMEKLKLTIQNWKSNHKSIFVVCEMCAFCLNWRKLFWVILCSLFECRIRWHCVCVWLLFKHSYLAGLFCFLYFVHLILMLHMFAFFYIRFMSQFFPIVYSIIQTYNLFNALKMFFFSFSPVYFVSVLFVIQLCIAKKDISYLTTLAFFSLSLTEWLSLDVEIHQKKNISNNTNWTCKYEKCVQKHRFLHDTLPRNGNATSNAMHGTVHTHLQ